jgi:hypothetical protein
MNAGDYERRESLFPRHATRSGFVWRTAQWQRTFRIGFGSVPLAHPSAGRGVVSESCVR